MTEEGFKILFDAHFEEIRRYIFFRSGDPVISTDIAQETFLKIWEKQMDLNPEKDLPLLYKMAGDQLISHFRREKISRRVHREMDLELSEYQKQDIDYKELKDLYRKALMKLPDKQRVVFLMSRMEQFTYPEISDRLGISIKAVEKRMNRALKSLRIELIRR